MNPYNNNPFKTDTNKVENEHDANRELAKTRDQLTRGIGAVMAPLKKDELGFWKED